MYLRTLPVLNRKGRAKGRYLRTVAYVLFEFIVPERNFYSIENSGEQEASQVVQW